MVTETVTNKQIMEELRRIKNALKLEKMIWFGSRVRGDYTQFSDVDVVVVDKRYEGVDFIKRPVEILEMWNLPVDLEVLCYTPQEFEKMKKGLNIVRRSVEEGIEV